MRSILFAILTALASFTPIPAQIQHFSASLEGAQEVPPVATTGKGWGLVRLNQTSGEISIFVHAEGVPGIAAHLHFAPFGLNGPVAVPLIGGPIDWTGSSILSMNQVSDLVAGGAYLNVHSAAHPGGEIRGQVCAEVTTRFTTNLDGATATPPTPSAATGQLIAYLHAPENRLTYELEVMGMVGTVAHIHLGASGVPGPVIIPLRGSGNRWCGVTARLTATQLADLQAGNFYVNAHSANFPGGEIRGQVLSDPGDFVAVLNGSKAVPPDNTQAIGHACLTLNPDRSLSYHVTTKNLVSNAAHIHMGVSGVNGPIIFPLVGGPSEWQGTVGPLTDPQVATLVSGGYYINVHSATHPGVEIRSQVELAILPNTFGAGCLDSQGGQAEIGSAGAACLGEHFTVTVHGSLPGSQASLLFGRSRNQFNMLPLPLSLGVLGIPDCFLFHDTTLTGQARTVMTDGLGCAKASLSLPADSGLIGFELFGQWFISDPGASPGLTLAFSNGLQTRLQ